MKIDLTERQAEAVINVLNERLAGGVDDLKDARGLSRKEANATWTALGRALDKLVAARPHRACDHINGDPFDNSLENVRVVNDKENLGVK